MNRTDRLLAMILELQAKGWQRAEDLAQVFEISKRTVYRDMQALAESGVPVVSSPGQGYRLDEGYFLPPLSFNTDEAICLVLGSDVVAQKFDAQYRASARSALQKINAVFAPRLRAEVDELKNSLRFLDVDISAADTDTIAQLRRAILERQRVRIAYETRHTNAAVRRNQREVDPYALTYIRTAWYLIGYCHLRQDVRYFRLDRIDQLTVLKVRFERPADFRPELKESGPRDLLVEVLFSHDVKRWVREDPGFYTSHMEDHPDGLRVTLRVQHEQDILLWLLSWGRQVRVLSPPGLQRLLVDEAEAIAAHYQTR